MIVSKNYKNIRLNKITLLVSGENTEFKKIGKINALLDGIIKKSSKNTNHRKVHKLLRICVPIVVHFKMNNELFLWKWISFHRLRCGFWWKIRSSEGPTR